MQNPLPADISRDHLLKAIKQIDEGADTKFYESHTYDVLYEGVRYSPREVVGVAAKIHTGVEYTPKSFKGGKDTPWYNLLVRHGFEIVPKKTEAFWPFEIDKAYTRKDVYDVCGVPASNQGGDWDTGYHKHNGSWFIFCTVGSAARTGHDYQNRFDGEELIWFGKTNSHSGQPSIQSLLSPDSKVYVFSRKIARTPFTFLGLGIPVSVREDSKPIEVKWSFEGIDKNKSEITPGEVKPRKKYKEGSIKTVLVNAYERNTQARLDCINEYGVRCRVCYFDFGQTYGQLGEGFIHVHHLRPLHEVGEEYELDPIEDLRPVCPNCHAMLHRRKQTLSIEELKQILELKH